jgi:hypothetical protein
MMKHDTGASDRSGRLRPTDEAVPILPYLRDPSPAVAERIRWLFLVQDSLPAAVAQAVREADLTLIRERSGPDKTAR